MDTAQTLYLQLERLSRVIETAMGLHYPVSRLDDLRRGIGSAAREFGFGSVEPCVEWLLRTTLTPGQIATLASHLTISETYFFRNRRVFEILEEQILPQMIQAKRGRDQTLKIWSAGCSTGEEAYSIAITLARVIPDLRYWDITILATDISPTALKKASAGLYSSWSFRDAPAWLTEKWFEKKGPNFAIAPPIKQMVRFSSLNMVSEVYPAAHNDTTAMDLIFCRNIMMYFARPTADSIVNKLSRCLVDGGWFVANPLEVSFSGESQHLSLVQFPGVAFYRKGPIKQHSPLAVVERPAIPVRDAPEKAPVRTPTEGDSQGQKKRDLLTVKQKGIDFGSLLDRARQLANRGRLVEAFQICADALQKDRLHPDLYFLQATILQELGRNQEAADALQRALYLDQDNIMTHFALGRVLYRLGRNEEAERHLATVRLLLLPYEDNDIVPESEGLTVGRFRELVSTMQTA